MGHSLTFLALTLIGADKAPEPQPAPAPAPCPPASSPSAAADTERDNAKERWRLTLRDAIRIGLGNAKVVRVVRPEGADPVGPAAEGITIAPAQGNDGRSAWRFKAEVMAAVRSIEQQYWSLAQQYVQLWASERAVDLAKEVFQREESKLEAGHGSSADTAKAQQRLERFQFDLREKISDVRAVERQLRNLMGLPPVDDRRIIPASEPTGVRVEPDWDSCLAAMMEKQPDVGQQKDALKNAKRPPASDADAALAFLPDLANLGELAPAPGETERARTDLQKNQELLKQVVHQTAHSLARFFLEVSANYQHYQTAVRLREAAAQRHEVQKAFYEEGRITIDRYLDSIAQLTSALGQEAQFKAAYNISLLALEEAKGTLLERKKITLVDGPKPARAGKKDDRAKVASFEEKAEPPKADGGDAKTAVAPKDGGKTVSFGLTIGTGPNPVEIRGSFTVAPAKKADATAKP